MEKLISLLTDYMQAAKGVIVTYAPQVWEATLLLVRITGVFYLVLGFIGLGLFLFCLKSLFKNIELAQSAKYNEEHQFVFRCVLSVAFGVASFVTALVNLLDVHHWLAAFAPQLAVMQALAEKAGLIN